MDSDSLVLIVLFMCYHYRQVCKCSILKGSGIGQVKVANHSQFLCMITFVKCV